MFLIMRVILRVWFKMLFHPTRLRILIWQIFFGLLNAVSCEQVFLLPFYFFFLLSCSSFPGCVSHDDNASIEDFSRFCSIIAWSVVAHKLLRRYLLHTVYFIWVPRTNVVPSCATSKFFIESFMLCCPFLVYKALEAILALELCFMANIVFSGLWLTSNGPYSISELQCSNVFESSLASSSTYYFGSWKNRKSWASAWYVLTSTEYRFWQTSYINHQRVLVKNRFSTDFLSCFTAADVFQIETLVFN